METHALIALLVRPGAADQQLCEKLSATRFIAASDWNALRRHEREYLRCYAHGVAAQRSILVGRSAAMVHGLWTLPADDAPVHLVNPGKKPPAPAQWPEGVHCWSLTVPPLDIVELAPGGADEILRATTRARTAVDVARLHGVRHGVVAIDSLFLNKGREAERLIRAELESVVQRLRGKKGVAHARQALEWSSTRSESPYESLLRVILREHGIVAQEQMWIGRHVRPDFIWGQLVIEIDGGVKFNEDPKQASMNQIRRENWIRTQGYEVARFEPLHVLLNEADCVREILELKARSELLGPPRVSPTAYRPTKGENWRAVRSG